MSLEARRAAFRKGSAAQRHIGDLLEKVGGKLYRIGTTRRRGDYQGTMQTPGTADMLVFLPWPPPLVPPDDSDRSRSRLLVFVESKAGKGRLSPAQREFREMCLAAATAHWVGDLDAVIAELMKGGWLKPDSVPHYRLPGGGKAVD